MSSSPGFCLTCLTIIGSSDLMFARRIGRYEMLEAQLEAKGRPEAADANGRDGGEKKERKEKRSSHRDEKDRKHRHRRCAVNLQTASSDFPVLKQRLKNVQRCQLRAEL